MKLNIYVLAVAVTMFYAVSESSAQQPQNQPDIYEQAEMEADRLQKLLELEDWQAFYVDSTLKHDFPATWRTKCSLTGCWKLPIGARPR